MKGFRALRTREWNARPAWPAQARDIFGRSRSLPNAADMSGADCGACPCDPHRSAHGRERRQPLGGFRSACGSGRTRGSKLAVAVRAHERRDALVLRLNLATWSALADRIDLAPVGAVGIGTGAVQSKARLPGPPQICGPRRPGWQSTTAGQAARTDDDLSFPASAPPRRSRHELWQSGWPTCMDAVAAARAERVTGFDPSRPGSATAPRSRSRDGAARSCAVNPPTANSPRTASSAAANRCRGWLQGVGRARTNTPAATGRVEGRRR